MNDFDDLLGGAIGNRADAAPTLRPDFSDVLADRQQQTRRRTAVATVALVAVGVTGMAAFAVGSAQPAGTADGPVGSDGHAVPTTMLLTPSEQPETIWYCEGQLDASGAFPTTTTIAPATTVGGSVDSTPVQDELYVSATENSGYFRHCVLVEGGPTDESAAVVAPGEAYATEFATTTWIESADSYPEQPTPTTTTLFPSTAGAYTVQAGDSPISVAEMFDVPLEDLLDFNGWSSATEFPFPGNEIVIPPLGGPTCTVPGCEVVAIHTIEPGDYLVQIADTYCVSVDDILAINGWETANELGFPGDQVLIPPTSDLCPPTT